ncbi:MAG: histidine kinase [Muribaculaceae bacterium]|nr:histidine kinase [Muribaculaceae bacterium]
MNKNTRRKRFLLRFAIHVLALGLLFVLPEIVMSVVDVRRSSLEWRFYVKALIFVGVFYAEYCVVMRGCSDRHLFNWRFVGENLLLVAVGAILVWLTHPPFPPMQPHGGMFDGVAGGARHAVNPGSFMWIRDVGIIVLTISLAVAMRLSERIRLIEERRREIDDARRRDELIQLKSQLNPHFLFNALNTIYALTEIDAVKARAAVHTLSRMLRYALYEADRPSVELVREVEFIKDYVRLMDMRLAGSMKVDVRIECSDEARALPIAPMLFISLVENAFKHGVTGSHDAMIVIRFNAGADGRVECRVTNSVIEQDAGGEHGNHSGLGIANLKRRLELIYGESATLEVNRGAGLYTGWLTVDISASDTALA